MKLRKSLTMFLAVLIVALILPVAAMAVPAVSAECDFTDTNLYCDVYVNTAGDSLISGGVKLMYNPSELSNPIASKNETDWYFGPARPSYMDPETAVVGEVVFIVGKLDESSAHAGVNGSRVEMGHVSL